MKGLIVALLISCYLFNTFAFAGSTDPAGSGVPATPTNPAKQAAPPATQPTCNKKDEIATNPPPSVIRERGETGLLRLGEFVTVQVPHDKYIANFTKQDSNIQPTPVLYIQGFAINGLGWVSSGCENFSFYLTRTGQSRDVWGKILFKLDGLENTTVGIGTVQKGFIEDIGTAKLDLTMKHWSFWWGLLLVVVIGSIVWLGKSSGLLRDLPKRVTCGDTRTAPVPAKERPFSLGRVQMAFWFVLTVGAYTCIWLKTGEISNTIPDSILALMGISAGTTVISAVVDSNASSQAPATASGNFLQDLLSDSDGISFHRLQMFVWTIILGVVFINKVSTTLIMPDFDTQLLGLMGLASGTYLGFKIPAATAAAPAAATDTKAAAGAKAAEEAKVAANTKAAEDPATNTQKDTTNAKKADAPV